MTYGSLHQDAIIDCYFCLNNYFNSNKNFYLKIIYSSANNQISKYPKIFLAIIPFVNKILIELFINKTASPWKIKISIRLIEIWMSCWNI